MFCYSPNRNSYVRFRHLCTNTWIQGTNVPIDVDEERPIRLMVRTSPHLSFSCRHYKCMSLVSTVLLFLIQPVYCSFFFKLGTCATKEDKEAFAIVSVPTMEIRDLDFANDASAMLCTVVEKFTAGFLSPNDRRSSNKAKTK